MKHALTLAAEQRLARIEQARRAVLFEGGAGDGAACPPWGERDWIERSWRRCLAQGHRPDHALDFDPLPPPVRRRALESGQPLVSAARPLLEQLARAIADTRYFAILTDAQGIVVDVDGPIDRKDRRADLITRIGVDLSERNVATTSIGAALAELQPVWLHRGEHFYNDTTAYSCAGAPLFGPGGQCVGMLDLTGVEVPERPELLHLVAQTARSIENALALARPHTVLVRLNWPGNSLGDDASDGLVCLDDDGWVTGANQAARQMVPPLAQPGVGAVHSSDLFALPFEMLFDVARRYGNGSREPMVIPLWSGLRLAALPMPAGVAGRDLAAIAGHRKPAAKPLREVEIELIRKAVDEAHGNVVMAARALGISRATVYRKLGK